jgi:hypothetical protein
MHSSTITEKILDERPFQHLSSRGIVKFNIDRCDLDGELIITALKKVTEEEITLELCEMLTWHNINVCPKLLNGRSAYVKSVKINRVDSFE